METRDAHLVSSLEQALHLSEQVAHVGAPQEGHHLGQGPTRRLADVPRPGLEELADSQQHATSKVPLSENVCGAVPERRELFAPNDILAHAVDALQRQSERMTEGGLGHP